MPYSATAPRLINPPLGLHNLVARAGPHAGVDVDLTLLDAPDHRLIRSGVLLAHRVVEGRGEWFLGAPDWVPLLPEERIEPMSHGDLPEELAELVRPFRRGAPLGPAAALSCERREFALRDDSGTTLALLRDDRVTVRRGGLTTARYREVTMTPTGPGVTDEQDEWLNDCLGSVGATPVASFPRLASRLGAPATGPTDFPEPPPVGPAGTFGLFVSGLLARRLRELLRADLRVRAGEPAAAQDLLAAAARLRRELAGLSSVLEPAWVADLDEELGWLVEVAEQEPGRTGPEAEDPGGLRSRLRGERYLTLLERLVTAARAPAPGDSAQLPCREVLQSLLNAALQRLRESVSGLAVDSPAAAWEAARTVRYAVADVCTVFATVDPERVGRIQRRLAQATNLLDVVARHDRLADRAQGDVTGATAEEAFELGRRYEIEQRATRSAREAFLGRWAKAGKKLAG